MRQVRVLVACGLQLMFQLAVIVNLETIAVRPDRNQARATRTGTIAGRPEEPRLQNHCLARIALRHVETGCRLGNAEDIADAVIADAVARPEIAMGVVVEGAPSQ